MMSSQSIQSHINPSFGRKMPLYDRTVSSKPKSMSDLQGKQPLQYGGACFPYDPRGKEAVGFTPWSNSKTSLLEDRSPVSHISGMGGQNRIIYRQDGNSSDEGRSSSLHPSGVKQGFKLYTKSPVISSPTAAGKKQKNGGESLSPPSENTVYLAIPEPVYRLNPCCNELGCVIGHRYSMDHGSQRIPHAAFEHEWPHTDAQYIERGKAQEALLQQKHFERSAEALKRIPVGMYSPSTVRTFPAVIDPSYSYPFTLPPHALLGPLSEQSHRLHRGYPSFYPSHPAYEQMTSEVYQEHSHMPKYGPLTQHPVFYYPQANVEVESRAQCKDIGGKQREDVPVLLKSPLSNNRERYVVPQPLHREIPLPLSEETLHNHSFMRAFDHQAPGFYSNSSQIRELLNSNRSNVLPGGPYVDPLKTNLRKDKHTAALPQTNPPFLHVDQTCSPRRTNQPGIPPSSIPVNRFLPPFAGIHLHRPILPLTALNTDKLRDYPTFDAQVTCPVQVKGIPVSPQAWLPQSPQNASSRIHTTIPGSPSIPKIIYSPAVTPGRKENCPMPSPSTVTPKACLKRSISHSCSPARVKEEERELCEVGLLKKRPKVKMEGVLDKSKSDSHHMPVIDNVFSLAPYQAYLQAPGLLFPGRLPQRIVHTSEHKDVKSRPDLKERRQCQDERQPETCPDTRTESVEVVELKNIKVEKFDPSETITSVETTRDCSNVAIKKEREDACSSNREPVLVIKKVDPDELEAKPSQKKHKETLNESSKDERVPQVEASDQRDASKLHENKVDLQVASKTESQLPESRLKFTNIPPHCLKLSNYKIFFHATNQPTPVLPLEKPPAQPVVDFAPKPEVQMPVRKHFFELHQSFCKLLSKTVQASSKQDLKAWLSKVELSERASPPTKVKRLSCLFGRKAREAWLDDEMKSALHKLLERLREYTAQDRCPFPHVMRAGAVFLPMLVVKELLFPAVQGSFIDQVLQEHKVELRPTTLSEEKTLIQLHKRACSSRLRRLMSLKHLPEIYADVVSLMYYTSVCKHLGLDTASPANGVKDEACEETISCSPPVFSHIMAPPEPHPQEEQEDHQATINRNVAKSRVKNSSRRMFLDDSVSDEGEEVTEKGVNEEEFVVAEEESPTPRGEASENSWMCPLASDELPLSPSDTEMEESHSSDARLSLPVTPLVRSKKCSGVILKLRRLFGKGLSRKTACYQAVSDSGTLVDPPRTPDRDEDVGGELELHRRSPQRWRRTGNFYKALRPLSSSAQRKRRSLLKIKYCPYLSACHSAEHRRRWVLRSAVQRARRAMRFHYPDLVGKRIRHLYEEHDKSEVWYRGEVLRVHEANANPLKTIFEVRYDSEPEWKYYLELLIDYEKGWLKVED